MLLDNFISNIWSSDDIGAETVCWKFSWSSMLTLGCIQAKETMLSVIFSMKDFVKSKHRGRIRNIFIPFETNTLARWTLNKCSWRLRTTRKELRHVSRTKHVDGSSFWSRPLVGHRAAKHGWRHSHSPLNPSKCQYRHANPCAMALEACRRGVLRYVVL